MALNLQQLKEWPPEIADLAQSARDAATNHTDSADFYRSVLTVSTWEGQGAQAARSAMTATASDHDTVADSLGTAASRMASVHQDAEELAETIRRILDEAATQPAVTIDETTNQVIPPDTSHMTEEYAAQVAAKVTDLQGRIAAVIADGERVDAELAGAITAASGNAQPVAKSAGSLQDLLLPGDPAQRRGPKPGEPSSTPDSLDSALDQLTGEPSDGTPSPTPGEAGGTSAAGPLPVDPAKVQQFKELARQTMLSDGVPPEQIEQRLDAIVAAAQKPLPASKPTESGPKPPPSFADGFADGWFNTEEGIRDLVGANGSEDLKNAWTDMVKGGWERVTNPIDSLTEEVEHLTKYPGHYLGELAGGTAITAPGAVLGGEAALAARGVGAGIPDDVIHTPSATGTVEHSSPLADAPSHHGTHVPMPDGPPPLPPESPLFDGYDPIPPGPEFTNPGGGLIYPDDSLPSKPYATPGTVIDNAQLPAGTELGRFGYPGGTYLAPDGTPFAELSLPPDSATKPYFRYVVDDPAALPPGWRIEQSQAAPWFHQPGGGTQYRIIAPPGPEPSVDSLRQSGYLKRIGG
ncbi:glycohydrolase toxin TNT-related protein [Mycolicibacterium baixiangningiae]|uniref:glycohydrolase toxin TNT-related protein n=1 Tax=Mycolicibacterium baixiangningiae TaxID=2761578 RepID=UPI0018D06186|nr:glycohydrolase toxin TNT-related protein [Mycolicibacterium baixiangningiae]